MMAQATRVSVALLLGLIASLSLIGVPRAFAEALIPVATQRVLARNLAIYLQNPSRENQGAVLRQVMSLQQASEIVDRSAANRDRERGPYLSRSSTAIIAIVAGMTGIASTTGTEFAIGGDFTVAILAAFPALYAIVGGTAYGLYTYIAADTRLRESWNEQMTQLVAELTPFFVELEYQGVRMIPEQRNRLVERMFRLFSFRCVSSLEGIAHVL